MYVVESECVCLWLGMREQVCACTWVCVYVPQPLNGNRQQPHANHNVRCCSNCRGQSHQNCTLLLASPESKSQHRSQPVSRLIPYHSQYYHPPTHPLRVTPTHLHPQAPTHTHTHTLNHARAHAHIYMHTHLVLQHLGNELVIGLPALCLNIILLGIQPAGR